MNRNTTGYMGATLALALATISFAGGYRVQNENGQWAEVGGRIQLQYHHTDPDSGASTDDLMFRRLRFYLKGSVVEDWYGKWQIDFGKGGTEIKDAHLTYEGIDGMEVSLGNMNFPFSRELITTSKKQQLIERTFVGDHNYGTPDRQPGLHLGGTLFNELFGWNLSGAMAAQDPDDRKLDFESGISLERGEDWSDGPMVGARLEFCPLGPVDYAQGDLKRSDPKVALAVAAFSWNNDDDNLDPTRSNHDVEQVNGFEIDAAFRGLGFSLDAQYNLFDSSLYDAADENGTLGAVTQGMYVDGETELSNLSIEGGYMIIPETLELVGGFQQQDADGYATEWNRTSVGANYFVHGHNVKYQLTYEINENRNGVDGNDSNDVYLQAQFVF